jgi:anti-anti-sigma regulatory factor
MEREIIPSNQSGGSLGTVALSELSNMLQREGSEMRTCAPQPEMTIA